MGYSTSGEFTNAERTKLANIESLADVTNNSNAVMDADFSGARGFMKKTSAGVYDLITSQELNADIIDLIRQMHPTVSVLAAMDETSYNQIIKDITTYKLDETYDIPLCDFSDDSKFNLTTIDNMEYDPDFNWLIPMPNVGDYIAGSDEFDDETIDTNLWDITSSNGSAVEGTDYGGSLHLAGSNLNNSWAQAETHTAINLAANRVYIKVYANTTHYYNSAQIIVTGASGHSYTFASDTPGNGYYIFEVYKDGGNLKIYKNGALWQTVADANTTFDIAFKPSHSSGGATAPHVYMMHFRAAPTLTSGSIESIANINGSQANVGKITNAFVGVVTPTIALDADGAGWGAENNLNNSVINITRLYGTSIKYRLSFSGGGQWHISSIGSSSNTTYDNGDIISNAMSANAAVLSFFSHMKGKYSNGGSTHALPVGVEIFGNGDSYAAALNGTTKFKIDVADPRIELYRTDNSVVAKSNTQENWTMDDNGSTGAFPSKTTSTHETILAEEIGCASVVMVEKSVNGSFTDTDILVEDDDYTVDYSTRTATKIILTSAEASDIVISQSKLRITWITDVEDIEGTANTALKMKIYLSRTAATEATPEIQKIDLGTDKYAELQYLCG